MEENYITLVGDNNEEILVEVLFTFVKDEENFVLLTPVTEIDDSDEVTEANVLAYKFIELEDGSIGELIEIKTDDD